MVRPGVGTESSFRLSSKTSRSSGRWQNQTPSSRHGHLATMLESAPRSPALLWESPARAGDDMGRTLGPPSNTPQSFWQGCTSQIRTCLCQRQGVPEFFKVHTPPPQMGNLSRMMPMHPKRWFCLPCGGGNPGSRRLIQATGRVCQPYCSSMLKYVCPTDLFPSP